MASLGAAHLFKACCIVGTGRHSGLLLCVLAIQQWVLDGVDGNEAMLIVDGAFGVVSHLVDFAWTPSLDQCSFLAGEVQVEADLADLPTSVAVVEDHDIVAVDYTTPGEPGT